MPKFAVEVYLDVKLTKSASKSNEAHRAEKHDGLGENHYSAQFGFTARGEASSSPQNYFSRHQQLAILFPGDWALNYFLDKNDGD